MTTFEDWYHWLGPGTLEKSDGKVNSIYFGVYFIVPERMVLCSLKVIL